MSLERQTITGVKWSATAKITTQIVAWAATLIVIRLLAPEDYGLMALSVVVISICGGVAELGLGAALIQARGLTRTEIARVCGALVLLNGACFAAVYAAAPLIAEAFGHSRLELIVRVSAAQFLLGALAAIPEALAYRDMRFRFLAGTDIASGLATSVATVALAVVGAGVWALVFGNLAGHAIRTIVLLCGGTFVRPVFFLRGIGQLVRFGGAWSAARFVWQLTYQADVLIAGRFLSQEAVGIYSVAVHLANLPAQKMMSVINPVAFPAIAQLQHDLPRMRRRMLEAIRLLGLGGIPVLWGIGAVAPEFVTVVLGSQWRSAIMPLQLIAMVAPLRMIATLCATAVSALGRADIELVNTLVSLAVFVAAFMIGVQWGFDGLAIGYAVAVCLSLSLNFPRIARFVGLSLREISGACRTPLIAGVTMLIAVACARLGLERLSEPYRLPVLIAIGAAAYLGALSLLDRGFWTEARKVVSALRETSTEAVDRVPPHP
jgi:O-antigen/teichoic acid export membrane protein